MLRDFGRAGYLAKVKEQPEKVQQVAAKLKTEGIKPTIDSLRAKLDYPLPLGYSNVGTVIEVGEDVEGYSVGDRVVSNGPHAEVVVVPEKLCAKIPDDVSDYQAVFTVAASIALHGVRLINPTLGETVAVYGLGLVGLCAVQLLRANGAKVIGFDAGSERVELAREYGATAVNVGLGGDPIQSCTVFSEGDGVDAVLLTASTQSSDLMHQAAHSCRKRGRIVLTGVTGLNLRRSDFYEKELEFKVSCSYGPGRYDPSYEIKGNDYPIGYVRWTEQRNFKAVLGMLSEGSINFSALATARVPFADAQKAYAALDNPETISVLLEYPKLEDEEKTVELLSNTIHHTVPRAANEKVVCAVLGAGEFTRQTILPALQKCELRKKWIISAQGVNSTIAAKRYSFETSSTDSQLPIDDPEVNTLIISTRHDTHADYVIKGLEAGKSVLVEKPLCLTKEELSLIRQVYSKAAKPDSEDRPLLMVDFYRRFSPLTEMLCQHFSDRLSPMALSFTCNAGMIPSEHWMHHDEQGGGRVLGEVCHFIDLLHHIVGKPITSISGSSITAPLHKDLQDSVSLSLAFSDGSLGNINYFTNGSARYPREHLSAFCEGRVIEILNFKKLKAYGFDSFKGKTLFFQDKGNNQAFLRFFNALRWGKESPTSAESIFHSTEASIAALEAIQSGSVVNLT